MMVRTSVGMGTLTQRVRVDFVQEVLAFFYRKKPTGLLPLAPNSLEINERLALSSISLVMMVLTLCGEHAKEYLYPRLPLGK